MRTLHRRRDPERESHISVVVATWQGDEILPGAVLMLDGLGACLVLGVNEAAADEGGLEPGEGAMALEVEALATGNQAPDIA